MKQFLDASGLNLYTQALKNGTLVVHDSSVAFYAQRVDANGILGVIPLENIPQGAIEKLVQVADETAMLALTASQVQVGDSVKNLETGRLYIVVNEAKLGTMDAFVEYSAGSAVHADNADWATNASHALDSSYAKDASNALYANKAGVAESTDWSVIQNKPTEFTPALHTQDGSTITALTGYSEAKTASDVAAGDSLITALGKIEKKADDAAAAAGDHVQDASTIKMTDYQIASVVADVASSDNALVAIGKVEKRALDASNTADWDGITNIPSEFTPADHDAAKVTSISGYSTTGISGDVTATDDLKTAIAKVEVKANSGADEPIPDATINKIIAGNF